MWNQSCYMKLRHGEPTKQRPQTSRHSLTIVGGESSAEPVVLHRACCDWCISLQPT